MRFLLERDEASRETILTVAFTDSDMRQVNLDRLDRMVLESPIANAVDALQSAQILAFRLRQQKIVDVLTPAADIPEGVATG